MREKELTADQIVKAQSRARDFAPTVMGDRKSVK
jgi:hypothetical protein